MKKIIEKTMSIFTLIATFSLMASPAYATLIALYDAEGNANDIVGGHNGINSGAGFAPGKIGQAFDFDGLDDVIRIPDTGIHVSPALTIAAWVRPESVGATNGTTGILYKGGQISTSGGQAYGFIQIGSGVAFRTAFNAAIFQTSLVNLDLDTFTHLVGTSDGSVMNFYVNGVLEQTRSAPREIDGGGGSALDLRIGSSLHFDSATSQYFDGQIDDVRIYDTALTSLEVQDLFSPPAPASAPAPVPEPSTMILLGSGLIGLVGFNYKRNKKTT